MQCQTLTALPDTAQPASRHRHDISKYTQMLWDERHVSCTAHEMFTNKHRTSSSWSPQAVADGIQPFLLSDFRAACAIGHVRGRRRSRVCAKPRTSLGDDAGLHASILAMRLDMQNSSARAAVFPHALLRMRNGTKTPVEIKERHCETKSRHGMCIICRHPGMPRTCMSGKNTRPNGEVGTSRVWLVVMQQNSHNPAVLMFMAMAIKSCETCIDGLWTCFDQGGFSSLVQQINQLSDDAHGSLMLTMDSRKTNSFKICCGVGDYAELATWLRQQRRLCDTSHDGVRAARDGVLDILAIAAARDGVPGILAPEPEQRAARDGVPDNLAPQPEQRAVRDSVLGNLAPRDDSLGALAFTAAQFENDNRQSDQRRLYEHDMLDHTPVKRRCLLDSAPGSPAVIVSPARWSDYTVPHTEPVRHAPPRRHLIFLDSLE